jgi:DNA-binding transcriptional regulator YiaG
VDASRSTAAAGEVVSLRSHAAYRPDFRGLAAGQISAARAKLGLTHAEFAEYLSELLGWVPSAAVVKRWEQGSIPPGDAVLAAAVISQDVPGDVLTLPLNPAAERRAGLLSAIGPALSHDTCESVTSYADRGLVSRQQWNGIIRGAASDLWLYGMAEFGYASDDEVPAILAEATANGCQARVLLLNPDYPGTEAIDRDEGHPPGTLTTRIRASLAQFSQIRKACGKQMQVRIYDGHPAVSVVRGDDRMFVTPYLRFIMGSNSPTFELRSELAAKMFSRYARHFDNTWNLAREWAG